MDNETERYGYGGPKEPHYLPSEAEIAREAARIRKEWTEQDYRRRAGIRTSGWFPPLARDRRPNR